MVLTSNPGFPGTDGGDSIFVNVTAKGGPGGAGGATPTVSVMNPALSGNGTAGENSSYGTGGSGGSDTDGGNAGGYGAGGGAEAPEAKPLALPLAVLIPIVGLAFLEGKAQTVL